MTMKAWMTNMERQLQEYREDMEYLLFAGAPAGLLMVLLSKCMNFLQLF
jgi:hypothetical protein